LKPAGFFSPYFPAFFTPAANVAKTEFFLFATGLLPGGPDP
jgi:hypothetical protein